LKDSSGNILFVILIAVALFATLGYAVTQSSRGGGSDTTKETATINAGVLSQYNASIRASLQRMTTDNKDPLTLEFNTPATLSSLTSSSVGVFHPDGGAVLYQNAPASVMDQTGVNPSGRWIFSLNFEVVNIGTSVNGSSDGNDLLAVLVGVKKSVCDQLNTKNGISINPYPLGTSHYYDSADVLSDSTIYMDQSYTPPALECVYGGAADDSALKGKSEACYFDAANNVYVYYNVLLER